MLSMLADIQPPKLKAKFLEQSKLALITEAGIDIDQNLTYDMAKLHSDLDEEEDLMVDT